MPLAVVSRVVERQGSPDREPRDDDGQVRFPERPEAGGERVSQVIRGRDELVLAARHLVDREDDRAAALQQMIEPGLVPQKRRGGGPTVDVDDDAVHLAALRRQYPDR